MDNRLFGLESQGSTLNLSLGGMGLMAPVAWPEGSQVRVHLDSLSLVVDGLVVFRQEASEDSNAQCRYGVKFQRMGLKELLKLRRALRENYKGPLAVL